MVAVELAEKNDIKRKSENADASRDGRKTVLIVDSSEETRDVLSTVLERRGVRTLSTATSRRGAALARESRPDLIVFDVDAEIVEPRRALDAFARNADLEDARTPIVAIGSATIEAPEGEFVAKPYHFAPLLQKIERLLESLDK